MLKAFGSIGVKQSKQLADLTSRTLTTRWYRVFTMALTNYK